MTRAVLIMLADPLPVFFSIAVGRANGAAAGWTPERDKATAFARVKDAREFADLYLPTSAPNCQYFPCEVSEA